MAKDKRPRETWESPTLEIADAGLNRTLECKILSTGDVEFRTVTYDRRVISVSVPVEVWTTVVAFVERNIGGTGGGG